jgi:outer membrane receptor protein involved in Fe transport
MGRVTDVASGSPLSSVWVLVSPDSLGVLSGDEGWYFLTGIPEGLHEITLSRLGYASVAESIQVAGSEAHLLDFQLRPEAIPLEELIISVEEGGGRSLGHRTVIRRERLEERRANTLSDLIQGLVPGVILTSPSGQVGASGQVRIRGVRSLQDAPPLFFVDGVRVGSAQMPGPPGTSQILDFLNSIPPRDVDRIEVVRNPEATLLYGADARGGVILIFTRRGGPS